MMPEEVLSREVQHEFIANDSARIVYWRRQVSPARGVLVFLHGVASNHTRWNEFLKRSSLTQTWDTLRLDLRGHGQSQLRGHVSQERWCDDVRELLDTCGYSQAIVVGHSMGANLAAYFAQRYPQRVAAMILIDPVHPQLLHLPLPVSISRMLLAVMAGAVLALNAIGLRRGALPPLDLEQLDQRARRLLAQGRSDEMERLYSSVREDLKTMPLAGFLQDIVQVLRPLPRLKTGTPVLLLLSVNGDPKAVELSRAYGKSMAQCHVVEIRCNHWILTAAPDEARAAIERWMALLA